MLDLSPLTMAVAPVSIASSGVVSSSLRLRAVADMPDVWCMAAGPMTAQDMTALFNPAPFGEERETPLQRALAEAPQLWDRLRNVDMDKEAAFLQVHGPVCMYAQRSAITMQASVAPGASHGLALCADMSRHAQRRGQICWSQRTLRPTCRASMTRPCADVALCLMQRLEQRAAAPSSDVANHGSDPAQRSATQQDVQPVAQEHSRNAADAIAAWQRVGRKGRTVLKRLSVHRVHELEELVTAFAASVRSCPFTRCGYAALKLAARGACMHVCLLTLDLLRTLWQAHSLLKGFFKVRALPALHVAGSCQSSATKRRQL